MLPRPAVPALLLLGFLLCIFGCRDESAKEQKMPEKIPTPPDMRFSAHEETWPPRPQGRTNVVNVPWSIRANALTEAREVELRNIAIHDAKVRGVLGRRFAYIAAAEVEPEKDRPGDGANERPVRLSFYSYTNNVAVDVFMRQSAVAEVNRREGYQPPESAEEIKAAIVLAQHDSRVAPATRGLRATAIVTYPSEGQAGYGHRILHVSFTATGGEEEVPKYYALVDLTDQKVVAAGRVGGK